MSVNLVGDSGAISMAGGVLARRAITNAFCDSGEAAMNLGLDVVLRAERRSKL